MRDIRYFWRDGLNSVGMSSEVELPQFRVLGHRQRATEINLTTGTQIKQYSKKKAKPTLFDFHKEPFFICLEHKNKKSLLFYRIPYVHLISQKKK